jgi:hypothetical protein
LLVGDAEALELAAVAVAELEAAPLTPALEIMVPGAVRILVGTVVAVGLAFVAATTIPPAAVAAVGVAAAPPSDSETAADSPVLRTIYVPSPPPIRGY